MASSQGEAKRIVPAETAAAHSVLILRACQRRASRRMRLLCRAEGRDGSPVANTGLCG